MASETGSGDIQIDVSSAIKEVARLNAAYETMRKGGVSAVDDLTKAFNAQQKAQEGLTKDQIRAAKEIVKAEQKASKDRAQAFKDAELDIQRAQQLAAQQRDRIRREDAKADAEAAKVRADLDKGAFGIGGAALKDVARTATAAAAGFAAVGGAAYGAVEALSAGADVILEIDDASRKLTVGRDTLLALAKAGESTGLAFSEIEGAIGNLPERIIEAAKGGNEYADSFAALGVSLTDGKGKIRDVDSVLRDLMSALAGVEDQSVKAGLAQKLLSDAGLSLVQTGALDSKEALDKYLNSVQNSTLITDESVRAARNWRAALSDLGGVADKTKVQLFNAFGDDAAQLIDNVSLALEFLRTYGLEKLQNTVTRSVAGLELLWETASGSISMKEAGQRAKGLEEELRKSEDAAWDSVKAFYEHRKELRETTLAAGKASDSSTTLTLTTKAQTDAQKAAATEAKRLHDELTKYTQAGEDAEDAFVKLTRQLNKINDAEKRNIITSAEATAARAVAAEKFEDDAKKEADAASKAAKDILKTEREAAATVRDLRLKGQGYVKDDATEREQIEITLQERLMEIRDAAMKAQEQDGVDLVALNQAAADASADAWKAYNQDVADYSKEVVLDVADRAAELADKLDGYLGQVADNHKDAASELEDQIEAAEEKGDHRRVSRLKKQLAEEKSAAETALERQKAAGIISATISGAKAAVEALALPPAPNFIAAGLSAAATGIEIATIAAQPTTFHSGTGFAPDETTAKILRGEAVLTEGAAAGLGRETIDQLNRGGGGTMDVRIVAWDVDPGSMAPIPVSGAGGDGTRSAFYGSPTARGGRKRGKAPGVRRSGHSSRTK